MRKFINYCKESYVELTKKVSWPTWSKLQSSALLVMVVTVILALVLFVIDFAFEHLMTAISITMGDMKWYVLRTAGSKEKKAAEYLKKEIERFNLGDQVAQVLVPVKREIVTKNGKRKVVERLLYPSYVLIQAELSPELEYIIRNDIPGMSGFLTEKRTNGSLTERVPVPIRDEEAQFIIGNQDQNVDNPVETEVNFEIGESVKITDGPFSGFSGTVDAIEEDRSKLKVIVVIFGRKTQLELSFTQVTKE